MSTMNTTQATWDYEFTDTFGDQPNFSWVNRGSVVGTREEALREVFSRIGMHRWEAAIVDRSDVTEYWIPQFNCVLFFYEQEVLQ